MDLQPLSNLLSSQAGVVSRAQILELGGGDNDIERMVRRRELQVIHRGVYVNHTGAPTLRQREWAAVLACWPAALDRNSSRRAHGLRVEAEVSGSTRGRADGPIEVLVDASRRVQAPPGVHVARSRNFRSVVLHNLSPPRTRIEYAVLVDASEARTTDGAVAVLADACQSRRTTAQRLFEQLGTMTRLSRRRLLHEVLEDVATGAYSALERRYLRHVERAHGLPRGRRQRRESVEQGVAFRDVLYPEQSFLAELDGRLGHEWAADRWSDLDRDVASAEQQRLTVRIGWKQVLEPCRLAAAVVRILRARGWEGRPRPCSRSCPLGDRGAFPAPGAGNPPQSPAA